MRRHDLRRQVCGLGLALFLFPGTAVVAPRFAPRAEAAFAGQNGRLAFSVFMTPVLNQEYPGAAVADHDIFTIAPGGAGIRNVTAGPDTDIQPAWSPDGTEIAFLRIDPAYRSDIFVVDADGGDETQLTDTPAAFEHQPAWSPDGTQIVFSSDAASPDVRGSLGNIFMDCCQGEAEWDLYVMNADGSDLRRLTSHAGYESQPSWSPDGEWIAYQRGESVALIRPDGSRDHIVFSRSLLASPQWSPDSAQIAFGSRGGMIVMNIDGSGGRALLPRSKSDDRFPSWSPDGRWIAFISDRDGTWEVYKMRPDGSEISKLIDIDLRCGCETPDWGPRR